MKLPLNWIREFVDIDEAPAAIAARLTMAGLECEIVQPEPLTRSVVVGRIIDIEPHPDADRLRVCRVDVGEAAPLTIVCGAPNARAGLSVAVARVGSQLPGGQRIEAAAVRGVDSAGMLCSAEELGLEDRADGLLELDADAPVGRPLADYLQLDDPAIEFELTPNRGDCLSVLGIARELAALYARPLRLPTWLSPTVDESVGLREVAIEDVAQSPMYCGRVIDGLDTAARTPDAMRERLRRAGLRSISAAVDVTNYVMLALGQPLHAFDDDRLRGGISVRCARPGESLRLLNGQIIELGASDLVIADAQGPQALAGVMGGADSETGDGSTRIFLESACFAPAALAGTGRRHKLHTDASHRFERGVDPALARRAIDYATALIGELCGGRAGPVTVAGDAEPAARQPVRLRHARMEALLGVPVTAEQLRGALESLQMQVEADGGDWQVTPPSHRYDVAIEQDLVEEVIRLIGYEQIPSQPYAADLRPFPVPESSRSALGLCRALGARGYQEAVCYSFVDPAVLAVLDPDASPIRLDNPIADTMAEMRTTLWAGLVPAVRYNRQRQQRRVRLFELANTYHLQQGEVVEVRRLAGAVCGDRLPEQWGADSIESDFYDVRGDLDALLPGLDYVAATHPALHPGRSARVERHGQAIGWLGQIHPRVAQRLDVPGTLILFELDWAALAPQAVPQSPRVSDYPASRRDLALEVDEQVPAAALQRSALAAGGEWLQHVTVFDVYHGEGLREGCKSVALGLIFQDYSSTLVERQVEDAVKAVIDALQAQWGATTRG